jgi:endoglucanase
MPLRTRGAEIVDSDGHAVRLRGVNIGGWLNMENFITGYAANESMMRAAVRGVLGDVSYELFFERLLSSFYADADVAFLAGLGLNCVRIPVNYRHLESDAAPLEVIEDGFRHLDRAIAAGGAHGVYSIIDLHALPGAQNQHWHSDNPTHRALFWEHRHFQDRVVNLWEAIADRYKGSAWVAGYNLMNEPADESRAVVGPFYARLAAAIRAVDPDHILFLDGNTYSTDFGVFDEPLDNAVYSLHDYVPAGLGRGGDSDPDSIERRFLERSRFARDTGTPIYVGEFGPIYTGDPATDATRRRILDDQLEIYRRHGAGFAIWPYKDLGRQGLTGVRPDSPYGRLVADFVAKKIRLGVDQWGSTGEESHDVTQPVQDLVAREFPGFEPYPWGRFDWVRTLLLNVTLAQAMAHEYAELFRGLDDTELVALADSFAFGACAVRESLRDQLEKS